MAYANYYRILDISPDATEDEIKKAYRKRALKVHPDVNDSPNAAEQFKMLNEARDVLSDPSRRASYDRIYYSKVLGIRSTSSGLYGQAGYGNQGPSLGNWWEYDIPTNGTTGYAKYKPQEDPQQYTNPRRSRRVQEEVSEAEFSKYLLMFAVGAALLGALGSQQFFIVAVGCIAFWGVIQMTSSTRDFKQFDEFLRDGKSLVRLLVGIAVIMLGLGGILFDFFNLSVSGISATVIIVVFVVMGIVFAQIKRAAG